MVNPNESGSPARGRGRPPRSMDDIRAQAKDEPTLVNSYVAAALSDSSEQSVGHAIDQLRDAYGANIRYNTISEWRTGARRIPRDAALIMLTTAIPWALKEAGVPSRTVQKLPIPELARILCAAANLDREIAAWLLKAALGTQGKSDSAPKLEWCARALLPPHAH